MAPLLNCGETGFGAVYIEMLAQKSPRPNIPAFFDLIVVGAGPAGLTLAAEFAGTSTRVLVIESGSSEPLLADQALNYLETSGFPLSPGAGSRARAIGGTAAYWNTFVDRRQAWARLVPMDAGDFAPHPLRTDAHWPIPFSEVSRYYPRAYRACGLSDPTIDGSARFAISRGVFTVPGYHTNIEKFVPASWFTRHLPRRLRSSENITVIGGTTVSKLMLDLVGRKVTGVRLISRAGLATDISARVVVLAAGGIENARLLLATDSEMPSAVGRYLCDHVQLEAGTFRFLNGIGPRDLGAYDLWRRGGQFHMGKLQADDGARHASGSLNAGFSFRPVMATSPRNYRRRVLLAAAASTLALSQRSLRPKLGSGYWSRMPFQERLFSGFSVHVQIEQTPEASNRLVLGSTVDGVGIPRVRVVNTLSRSNIESFEASRREFVRAVQESGIAELVSEGSTPAAQQRGGMNHHMCTTKMAGDSANGVVNEHCGVFGVDNLFCAGSSVFATGGYANPTLTIIALAIRLAEHLKFEAGVHTGPASESISVSVR